MVWKRVGEWGRGTGQGARVLAVWVQPGEEGCVEVVRRHPSPPFFIPASG